MANFRLEILQVLLHSDACYDFCLKVELHPNTFQPGMPLVFMLFSWLAIGILISIAVFLSCDVSAQEQTDTNPNKSISVTHTNFSIQYSNTGDLNILSARTDVPAKSIVMTVQSAKGSLLTMTLPRDLIDRKDRGVDSPFFYVIGGYLSGEAKEVSDTTTQRTISIPIMDGTNLLVISGTQVIPEFGPAVEIITLVGIIGVMIISRVFFKSYFLQNNSIK